MKRKILFLLFSLLMGKVGSAQNNEELLKLWEGYLDKKAKPIELTQETNFEDLKALNSALAGKRIILLGEFNHGSKEINLLKNRIIQYLHQKLGYKILLLESGLGELNTLNHNRPGLAKENMIYRLTGPWQSEEFVSLMGYAQKNEDLVLGGFDPQKSGGSFVPFFQQKFGEIAPQLSKLLSEMEAQNQNFVRDIQRAELTPAHFLKRDSIIQAYQNILQSIQAHQPQFMQDKKTETDFKVIQKSIENRIAYLHYFTTYKKQLRQRWAARDSLMAANILWYVKELYPHEKIIISAHNYHISKYNEKELVMGEILNAQLPNELYTIGFFGGQGSFANNARKTENLSPAVGPKDIKAIASKLKAEAVFFDFPNKIKQKSSWLDDKITVGDTFIDLDNTPTMQIGKCFDGLFLLKNITPAVYKN